MFLNNNSITLVKFSFILWRYRSSLVFCIKKANNYGLIVFFFITPHIHTYAATNLCMDTVMNLWDAYCRFSNYIALREKRWYIISVIEFNRKIICYSNYISPVRLVILKSVLLTFIIIVSKKNFSSFFFNIIELFKTINDI